MKQFLLISYKHFALICKFFGKLVVLFEVNLHAQQAQHNIGRKTALETRHKNVAIN